MKMLLEKQVGENLRAARIAQKLMQSQLAAKLDVSQCNIYVDEPIARKEEARPSCDVLLNVKMPE